MKIPYKKKIILTGGNGLLGSNFKKKFSNRFKIISYPYRIEDISKFKKWLKFRKFDYFIHFASITRNEEKKYKSKIKIINFDSTQKIIETLNEKVIKHFKFFLFISSSHVYGHSPKKIKENNKRNPINEYGKSKKNVEDFIFKNRKKFYFKIGIARIFNTTGKNQKKGFFIPDMFEKIKKQSYINNINQYRDFIHIDDVLNSIKLIIMKEFTNPVNVSSGKKINLIQICRKINRFFFKNRKLYFDQKRRGDLYGNNNLLKKLGIKKFKNIDQIIRSYR